MAKRIRMIIPTQLSTNPESLVRISPVHSEIIDLIKII